MAEVKFALPGMDAKTCAKIAVRDMLRGHAVIIPGLRHEATLAARRLAPDWLMPRITYHIQHNKISRKRKK